MGLLMERTETAQEIVWRYKPKAFYLWWYGIFVLIIAVFFGFGIFGPVGGIGVMGFGMLWIFTGALSTLPFTFDMNRRKNTTIEGSWWQFLIGRGTMTYRMRK